jgi:ABC-type Fe3+ transport system substrate-binding protein
MSRDFRPPRGDGPAKSGWCLKVFIVLLVWVGVACAAYFLFRWATGVGNRDDGEVARASPSSSDTAHGSASETSAADASELAQVEIGIAYGTEKKHWLAAAVSEFAKTPAGRKIQVNLLPRGSIEAANEIVDGNSKIHVWSPASSMYREVFETRWGLRHTGDPIAKEERLALSPMVFVMWKDRYDALTGKFPELTFTTLEQALAVPGGWGGIAEQPDWGLFKFGHTDPGKSNSGLMTLVLMAYDFHRKNRGLAVADIVDPKFQAWMGKLEKAVSGLPHSTGTMMNDMVLMGPSTYDAIMVYESVAIDYLKSAEGRWGRIHVVYPKYNIWNDNPYYILDTEWVTDEHRQGAEAFLKFLMSEPIQARALEHGFRPGDARVPVKFPDSPFVKYEQYGLNIDLNLVCDPPSAEVINNLQQSWQRAVRMP